MILGRITDYRVPVYGVHIECKVVRKRRPDRITKDSGLYRGRIIGFSLYFISKQALMLNV